MKNSETFVHETAVVEKGAQVGDGTKVWHHVQICAGARVGSRCVFGKNVFVGRDVEIGAGVKLQNNVSVFAGVTLADDVFVGPSATFTNVRNPRAHVERKDDFEKTQVGRGATIGAHAAVVCGNSIGEYAFIGAGAVVTKDVEPYALVVGNPARRVGWVDRNGDWVDDNPGSGEVDPEPRIVAFDPLGDIDQHGSDYGRAVRRVLASGNYILGPEVSRFEEAIAKFVGADHCVGVSSGTDALLATLMALEVGPGDEVVTTPFSFFATVGAILRLGATPVFVDVRAESLDIDAELAAAAFTAKTKAVIGVPLFGQTYEQSRLTDACRDSGVHLIEDAAQAFGARGEVGLAGTEGTAGCYSFFPTKNLGGFGDGGAVVTSDGELAERLRQVRVHGATSKNHHELLGGNFRLDPIHAALLLEKLPRVEAEIGLRRRAATRYDELLVDAGLVGAGYVALPQRVGPDHTFNQYVIRAQRRDELKQALAAAGIMSAVYYPRLLSEQPITLGKSRTVGELNHARQATQEVLALPFYPGIGAEDQIAVVGAISEFYGI